MVLSLVSAPEAAIDCRGTKRSRPKDQRESRFVCFAAESTQSYTVADRQAEGAQDGPRQKETSMSGLLRFSVARSMMMIALLAGTASSARAAVPVWARLLRWISGDNDRTTVPVEAMGTHMQMSRRAPAQPGDLARGAVIISAARDVLRRYPDVANAERDGYRPRRCR